MLKVPYSGSACLDTCNLRDVPVWKRAQKIKHLDLRFFSDFVGSKNSISLSALWPKKYQAARIRLSHTWRKSITFLMGELP